MKLSTLLKTPTAYVPIAMSAMAFSMTVLHLLRFGAVHEADEGVSAHVFQLLMLAQLPIIGVFAVKFMPNEPRNACATMAIQLGAALLALTPVWWFGL